MTHITPQMRAEGSVRLFVHGFTTDYQRQPAVYRNTPAVVDLEGRVIKEAERQLLSEERTVEVDWVEYSPSGQEQLSRIKRRVVDMLDIPPLEDVQDVAAVTAHERKRLIEPLYKAWKGGQDMPVSGTPLGAWPGINQSQAEHIKLAGIRSVEDLATASESQLLKIRLPNQRDLRDMAKRFLAASGQQAEAANIARVEAENAALKEQMAEMRAILMSMQAQIGKAAAPDAGDASDDEELEVLRELAREAGISRVGNKSKETLEREIEALQKTRAA